MLLVRGDVGAVDGAERRHDGQATGIGGATGRGVAGHAIGCPRQVFTLFDLLLIGRLGLLDRHQGNRKTHGGGQAGK
ncbi:hypothetical protein D3C72_2265020 [compost metagenome]